MGIYLGFLQTTKNQNPSGSSIWFKQILKKNNSRFLGFHVFRHSFKKTNFYSFELCGLLKKKNKIDIYFFKVLHPYIKRKLNILFFCVASLRKKINNTKYLFFLFCGLLQSTKQTKYLVFLFCFAAFKEKETLKPLNI